MKNKLLYGVCGTLVGGALATYFYPSWSRSHDVIACTTEFNFTRNQGKESEVRVNAVAQFYFHRNGTGLTTYKGAAKAGGRDMIIDRDMNFTWTPKEDNNVIVLTYTKTWRRHNDDTPDAQWGSFAHADARYYLTIAEVAPSVWLIQDRLYPTYLCRGNQA